MIALYNLTLVNIRKILFCLVFISSISQAEKLTIAFGNSLAPWVMAETNSGILIDLITEAMTPLGYEVEYVYYPYARRIASFYLNKVNVVCDVNYTTIEKSKLTGFYSGTIYSYKNYVYSLSEKNYHFEDINDIGKHKFLSWQGAKNIMGYAYQAMVENNPNYRETHDQYLQVKMLFTKRTDIIQLDQQIFQYYRRQLIDKEGVGENIKVDRFALVGENPNGFLFRSQKARDDFVRQIELMMTDGRYRRIFEKYSK